MKAKIETMLQTRYPEWSAARVTETATKVIQAGAIMIDPNTGAIGFVDAMKLRDLAPKIGVDAVRALPAVRDGDIDGMARRSALELVAQGLSTQIGSTTSGVLPFVNTDEATLEAARKLLDQEGA